MTQRCKTTHSLRKDFVMAIKQSGMEQELVVNAPRSSNPSAPLPPAQLAAADDESFEQDVVALENHGVRIHNRLTTIRIVSAAAWTSYDILLR